MSVSVTAAWMNHFVEHGASGLKPRDFAEVFDRLIWLTDDNGGEILDELERWLREGDERRVRVALALESVFPFRDRSSMARELERIAAAWPELDARCRELVKRRDQAVGA
jgi:hypothetical protein